MRRIGKKRQDLEEGNAERWENLGEKEMQARKTVTVTEGLSCRLLD